MAGPRLPRSSDTASPRTANTLPRSRTRTGFRPSGCACSQVSLDFTDGDASVDVNEWDTYSVPGGVQRKLTALGDTPVEMLVVVSGDHRKRPVFAHEIIAQAKDAGLGLDAGGFVAKASLLPVYGRAS